MNQKQFKVFFAIPYDGATKPMYERLSDRLKKQYPGRFDFWIGNRHLVERSPLFARETFTAQNTDLFSQFYHHIVSSDIIVADLSYDNPNVHLELGIALAKNQNILHVSGRNLSELSFDVRNYEVNYYSDETSLYEQLLNYLDLYLLIKDLDIDDPQSPFYELHTDAPKFLEDRSQAKEATFQGEKIYPSSWIFRKMRDGGVRVRFQFCKVEQGEDWFGVSIRFPSNPWYGAYLLYIRMNGKLEFVEMPTVKAIAMTEYPSLGMEQEHTLSLNFDGSNVQASLDNSSNVINVPNLINQSFGNVAIICFRSRVEIIKLESLSQDTIDFSLPSQHLKED